MKSASNHKLLSPTLKPPVNTSTSFSRLRGMTLWVMEILKDGGSLASWQVAEQAMKSSRYINVYLNRLRTYGVAQKRDEFWFLTDFGKHLTNFLIGLRPDRYRYRYKYNTSITQEQHKNNTSRKAKPRQLSLAVWTRNCSLGEAERGVVDMLVAHYNKTGSKYILVKDHYALSDMLSINVDTCVNAITNLRQDHMVYLIMDRVSGCFKLGLKVAFVETLERDQLK